MSFEITLQAILRLALAYIKIFRTYSAFCYDRGDLDSRGRTVGGGENIRKSNKQEVLIRTG